MLQWSTYSIFIFLGSNDGSNLILSVWAGKMNIFSHSSFSRIYTHLLLDISRVCSNSVCTQLCVPKCVSMLCTHGPVPDSSFDFQTDIAQQVICG